MEKQWLFLESTQPIDDFLPALDLHTDFSFFFSFCFERLNQFLLFLIMHTIIEALQVT